MRPSRQAGFTLVELMVVVAVIAILAAVAVPQYQTYVARSQVARVMAETGAQKAAVEICVADVKLEASAISCAGTATGSSLLASGGNTQDGGAPSDTQRGVPTLAFEGAPGAATLTAAFGNSAAAILAGKTLTWSRSGDGTWTCTTDVAPRFRPTGCDGS